MVGNINFSSNILTSIFGRSQFCFELDSFVVVEADVFAYEEARHLIGLEFDPVNALCFENRDEAIRNTGYKSYSMYNGYMGNPEKTTCLFTEEKSRLEKGEKAKLKEVFETAQGNGSLMWQTVISFDNHWLEQNGLMDIKSITAMEDKAECTHFAAYTPDMFSYVKNDGFDKIFSKYLIGSPPAGSGRKRGFGIFNKGGC